MQRTSCEILGWMKHNLESRFSGEISITSDRQMTPPLWPKVQRNLRFSWWGWKRRVKKTGLKLNIQTTKIMASGLIISCQTDWKKWNHWQILSSWAPKSLQTVTAVMELKDFCSLEEKLECCSACNSNNGSSYRQSLYFGMQNWCLICTLYLKDTHSRAGT